MTLNTYTDIDVINTGLALIGEEPIASITDENLTAIETICARIWPKLKGFLLSAHQWNFCLHERELTVDADIDPLSDFEYAYRLPADLISGPFSVYGDGEAVRGYGWQVKGVHLYTNAQTVVVDYRRIAPVENWPIFFIDLASVAFGARASIPIADKSTRAAELKEEAYGSPNMKGKGGLMGLAIDNDAQSKPARSIYENGDPLTSARY